MLCHRISLGKGSDREEWDAILVSEIVPVDMPIERSSYLIPVSLNDLADILMVRYRMLSRQIREERIACLLLIRERMMGEQKNRKIIWRAFQKILKP